MNQQPIRIGIVGYGNLGRGVELAVGGQKDLSLVGVFTRREPTTLTPARKETLVYPLSRLEEMEQEMDVLILCGGSASDLPEMTPLYARNFHVVDSFDTHAKIPEHYQKVDAAAKQGGTVAIISVGWDPGLFSLQRTMAEAILPQGNSYTFWGEGISQGHSQAVRRVAGVADARQYTVPRQEALEQVRRGENPILSNAQRHTRVCYVVPEQGADVQAIQREILSMPHYFDEYETTVHFVTQEQLDREHQGLPHGGFVIRSGSTGDKNSQLMEFRLQLDSNPEFTASVLTAYARAAVRLGARGESGCKTAFDIPPGDLSPHSPEYLREQFL